MFLTALIMGIAGSLHCAGMCSPLAVAITNASTAVVRNRILYNAGRIITYGMLGAIVAVFGYVLPWNNFQNIVSIGLGLVLLAMAITGTTGIRIPFFTKAVLKFTVLLKKIFSRFIQNKTPGSLVLLGAVNGLLPCGLTFVALSFCLTVSTPLEGFVYMFTFGIGTLPVMLGFVSVLGFVTNRLKWNMKGVTLGMLAISGLLLIARVFMVHLPDGHHHSGVLDIVICR